MIVEKKSSYKNRINGIFNFRNFCIILIFRKMEEGLNQTANSLTPNKLDIIFSSRCRLNYLNAIDNKNELISLNFTFHTTYQL